MDMSSILLLRIVLLYLLPMTCHRHAMIANICFHAFYSFALLVATISNSTVFQTFLRVGSKSPPGLLLRGRILAF
jgi:hypothetical protein